MAGNQGVDQFKSQYNHTYTSFSGTDILATMRIPSYQDFEGYKDIVIGNLQTISYSTHREVSPVRTLGRVNPVGFTNGQRTIAGSLIFTIFDRNLVYNVIDALKERDPSRFKSGASYLMDEMPPFDIHVYFQNEYGQQSHLVIEGIVIVDEGQVMSIEDMITENTMSYMARNIQPLKNRLDGDVVSTPREEDVVVSLSPEVREDYEVKPNPNYPDPADPEAKDHSAGVKMDVLQLEFVDEVTREPVPGSKIAVYTLEDNMVVVREVQPNGFVTFDDLNEGKYYYRELTPSGGYTVDPNKYPFRIWENGVVQKETRERLTIN